MAVPSLSVSVHDRYGPEIRDAIIEKLNTPLTADSYQMLTPGHLRSLSEIESTGDPVISLYLQLGPDRRVGGGWRTVFRNLTRNAQELVTKRHVREVLRREFARIETTLDSELPGLGRGVAFFVCRQLALWNQIALPLPLPDYVHLGPRPYLRPLARTRDEHDRFVLVLLSQQLNRLFIGQIGQVQEALQIRSSAAHKMVVHHGPREPGGSQVTEALAIEAKIVANAVELLMKQFEGRYRMLSGTADLRAALVSSVPKRAGAQAGDIFSVDIHAPPSEVAAEAEPVQRSVEAREEMSTVQRLIDAGPNGSAWGELATFAALHKGRVHTLVIDDTYCKPGVRCLTCNALWGEVVTSCATCGDTRTEPVGDVVELSLEYALRQKAALELVRSRAAREVMTGIGPIAAVLRW